MAGLSMPSSRGAGQRNALMGGPPEHSGKPGQTVANILAGGAPAVATAGNALAAGVMPPPPPPPPPVAVAAPVAVAVQPEPDAPPGQEQHAAVGATLGANNLPDDELATRLERSMFVQNALRALLQKDTPPDHGDVAQVLADGVKSGVVSAADAPVIMAAIPQDPAQLRPAIEALNRTATHAAVHIVGEQQRRGSKS